MPAFKTYRKKSKTTSNLSITSITIRKKRLKIKELPKQTSRYLYDDSLKIDTDDTFDKLKNGQIFNQIKIKDGFIKNLTTSDSDLSIKTKTKSTISIQIHSPIMTRSITKILTEISDNTKSISNNQPINCNYKLTSLDKPVDISLSVEKDTKKHVTFSSLSYIKIPAIDRKKHRRMISSTPYDIEKSVSLSTSTVSPIIPHSNNNNNKSEINLSNLTPKLKRNKARTVAKKLNCPPRLLLHIFKDSNFNNNNNSAPREHSSKLGLKGFTDEKIQESIDKSNDCINLENQQNIINNNNSNKKQLNSPKVILDDCFEGFTDAKIQQSIDKSNSFINLENQQLDSLLLKTISHNESAIISSLYLTDSHLNINNNSQLDNDKELDDQQYSCLLRLSNKNCTFNNNSYRETSHNLSDIIESSITDDDDQLQLITIRKKHNIKPGKSYRRSIVLLKQPFIDYSSDKSNRQSIKRKSTLRNSQIIPLNSNNRRPTTNYTNLSYVQEQEEKSNVSIDTLENSFKTFALRTTEPELLLNQQHEEQQQQQQIEDNCVTAKEKVLRKCQQTEPIIFEECYPDSILNNCHKIGEGVYGEVFLYKKPSGISSVIKIIPIEGDLIVNGERQKTYEEVLSEIIISLELSNLRKNGDNLTTSFVEVQNVNCVIGRYPNKLIDLWHLYDETKGSENDSPEIFVNQQLYIVLELANAGQDAESFVFNNALQAFSMFKQVACALAVAENELKFEHRDLHWGNVLIKKVDTRKKINFILDKHNIEICSYGIEVTIIDYTLSRAQFEGVVVFNDLSQDDDLFKGTDDYQFDIYRLMQQANRNNWQDFQPQSNIFWLHYLLKKMIDGLRYLNIKTKTHRDNIKKIQEFEGEILNFDNAVSFVRQKFIKKSKIC